MQFPEFWFRIEKIDRTVVKIPLHLVFLAAKRSHEL